MVHDHSYDQPSDFTASGESKFLPEQPSGRRSVFAEGRLSSPIDRNRGIIPVATNSEPELSQAQAGSPSPSTRVRKRRRTKADYRLKSTGDKNLTLKFIKKSVKSDLLKKVSDSRSPSSSSSEGASPAKKRPSLAFSSQLVNIPSEVKKEPTTSSASISDDPMGPFADRIKCEDIQTSEFGDFEQQLAEADLEPNPPLNDDDVLLLDGGHSMSDVTESPPKPCGTASCFPKTSSDQSGNRAPLLSTPSEASEGSTQSPQCASIPPVGSAGAESPHHYDAPRPQFESELDPQSPVHAMMVNACRTGGDAHPLFTLIQSTYRLLVSTFCAGWGTPVLTTENSVLDLINWVKDEWVKIPADYLKSEIGFVGYWLNLYHAMEAKFTGWEGEATGNPNQKAQTKCVLFAHALNLWKSEPLKAARASPEILELIQPTWVPPYSRDVTEAERKDSKSKISKFWVSANTGRFTMLKLSKIAANEGQLKMERQQKIINLFHRFMDQVPKLQPSKVVILPIIENDLVPVGKGATTSGSLSDPNQYPLMMALKSKPPITLPSPSPAEAKLAEVAPTEKYVYAIKGLPKGDSGPKYQGERSFRPISSKSDNTYAQIWPNSPIDNEYNKTFSKKFLDDESRWGDTRPRGKSRPRGRYSAGDPNPRGTTGGRGKSLLRGSDRVRESSARYSDGANFTPLGNRPGSRLIRIQIRFRLCFHLSWT